MNSPNIPKMSVVFFDPFGLVEGVLCAGRWWSVGDHERREGHEEGVSRGEGDSRLGNAGAKELSKSGTVGQAVGWRL